MKNTKILSVLAVILAMGLTACGGPKSSEQPGGDSGSGAQPSQSSDEQPSSSTHKHSYGEWQTTKPATCTEDGEKERVCECGDKQTEKIPATGHTFVEGAEEYIQDGVKYLECSACHNAAALEWAAKDYAASESVMEATASDGSVRFTSSPTAANAAGDGIVEKSYAVYNIQLHKAVEHAGLDFDIEPSSHNVEIFDSQSNDQKPGKDIDAEGNIIDAPKRYALYVNDVRVQIGTDPGASTERGWYSWPVDFALKKGENKIKLVCMGGYRAKMYNFRLTNVPLFEHEHEYGAKIAENAAGEGFVATQTMACTLNCGKTAIKWSALDYDATKTAARSSANKGPESRDSGKAIRFSDEVQYKASQNDAGEWIPNEELKGCHIVYNVKTPAAQNVGLAIYSTARSDVATVFDKHEGDTAKGYEMINGALARPDSRYGLKVDGQIYFLEADEQAWNGTTWYQMPVTIPSLEAGIHEIEIYNFGGYRVDMYNFMLTGLPAVEGSVFTLGEEWKSDDNGHWKEVAGQDGVKFVYHEHILVADPEGANVAPTCTEAGKEFKKCSVCGKKVELTVAAKGHNWVADTSKTDVPATCTVDGVAYKKCSNCDATDEQVIKATGHQISQGTAVKNSDDKDVTPITCAKGDVEGYEMALADHSGADDTANAIADDGKIAKSAVLTWKFKLTADSEGHYKAGKVSFVMCARLNGGTTGWGSNATPADTAFANDYSIKVGEKAGTVTCAGKQLGKDFGATIDDAVYFEFGTVEFVAEDLVNGELCVTVTQAANQGYRFRYQDNVRIIYLP